MRTRFWRVRTRKGDGLEWIVVDEVKAMVGASENGTRQAGGSEDPTVWGLSGAWA